MDALIRQLEDKQDLSDIEVQVACELLLDPNGPDEKKARLLEALSIKGETPAEIASFVECFLEHAVNPHLDLLELDMPTLDVCGTGGDQLDLFNVSTTSMFVAAAAGAIVIKHGNRGITSKSGGADVLEALGIKIDLKPEEFRRCIEIAGVGFMFAPVYHPAFKAVVAVRKSLAQRGVKTIFNLIGPLLNPARPECQLIGVFNRSLCPAFAEICERLGRQSAWVVNGSTADGQAVDELSLMGNTRICKAGIHQEQTDEVVHPADFDLQLATLDDLRGGDASHNALILQNILAGVETGPKRDMVLLNAGAAIACTGIADNLMDGIDMARDAISSGAASEKLILLQVAAER